MANRERGEVGVDVEPRGKHYTLTPTFDATCQLEQLTGKSFEQALEQIAGGWLSGLRATVWCLLQEHHSDEVRTLKDASEWIEDAGGTDAVLPLVNAIVGANTEPVAEGKTKRPRKARAGTGGSLSLAPAKSA
jgi:hypothetical protein